MIWKRPNDLEALNANLKNTLCQITGMRVTKVTDNALYGEMPVDKRTHQPMGLLHGGASAALAERSWKHCREPDLRGKPICRLVSKSQPVILHQ